MNQKEMVDHLHDRLQKAVEELERQGSRVSTIEDICGELDQILELARFHGISQIDNESEMEVFLRWAGIKEMYEAGHKPELFRGYHHRMKHSLMIQSLVWQSQ